MQLATQYTLLFFSSPLLATLLLLFPVISGPGSKIWLTSVRTQTYGTISVGALGICAGEMCLKSGFGYDSGDQLGKVIPRFPAAGVFHLITLVCLVLGTLAHAHFLPRLHAIRETRQSWVMWIVPAACSLLLLICVIIDFALLAQLKTDKVLLNPSTLDKDGMQDVPVHTIQSHPVSSGTTILVSGYPPYATVSSSTPTQVSPLPSGVPQKLSLRALADDPIHANTNTISAPSVTAQGALYLPIISLILCLIWLYASVHFLRKSKISEHVREHVERETYRERILARKRVREENPVEENYGWFQFGRQGKGKGEGEGEGQGKEGGGQGWGWGRVVPAWMGGADKDAAPSGFV